jgi:hypothetical protein
MSWSISRRRGLAQALHFPGLGTPAYATLPSSLTCQRGLDHVAWRRGPLRGWVQVKMRAGATAGPSGRTGELPAASRSARPPLRGSPLRVACPQRCLGRQCRCGIPPGVYPVRCPHLKLRWRLWYPGRRTGPLLGTSPAGGARISRSRWGRSAQGTLYQVKTRASRSR